MNFLYHYFHSIHCPFHHTVSPSILTPLLHFPRENNAGKCRSKAGHRARYLCYGPGHTTFSIEGCPESKSAASNFGVSRQHLCQSNTTDMVQPADRGYSGQVDAQYERYWEPGLAKEFVMLVAVYGHNRQYCCCLNSWLVDSHVW